MKNSMKLRINGAYLYVAHHAPLNQLKRIVLSNSQSETLLTQLSHKDFVEEYRLSPSEQTQAQAGAILAAILDDSQIEIVRSGQFFHFLGLRAPKELKFQSYAGMDTRSRAIDTGSMVSALLIEGLAWLMGAAFVRLEGVHDRENKDHYISTIAAIPGEEANANSGGLADFGFHGDNDGVFHKLVDQLMLVGQIADGMTPTLYSELDWALAYLNAKHSQPRIAEILAVLAKPMYQIHQPMLAGIQDQGWLRSVYVPGENEFFLHPLLQIDENVPTDIKCLALFALSELREALEQTAIGVSLQPFQVLHMPNRKGKHAVWEKCTFNTRVNQRQLQRLWLNTHLRQNGSNILSATLNK